MVKRFTITVDDFLYDLLFTETVGNRSSHIRRLIYNGIEALKEPEKHKGTIQLISEIESNKTELQRLKLENGALRAKLKGKNILTPEEQLARMKRKAESDLAQYILENPEEFQ